MNDKITLEKIFERLEKLPPREDQSEDDRRFYSEIGRSLLIRHLEFLMEERQWVSGVIMSALMLEFAGKTRLIWKYKRSVSSRKIRRLKFASTTKCLLASRIIDNDIFKKMEKIREARNDLAHELLRHVVASFKNESNPELEALIREAIEVVKILF